MSDNLRIDPSAMTIGDLEDFEEVTGTTMEKAFKPVRVLDDEGKPTFDEKGRPVTGVDISAKALKALIWIIKRQDNPAFTLDDARNVKVNELVIDGDDDDVDPTPAA